MKSSLVDIEVYLHSESRPGKSDEGAILVSLDGERAKAVWLPKSACEFYRKQPGSSLHVVMLPEALATERGLT